MKTYTKDALKKMELAELRKVAKTHGVKTAGAAAADLIRGILKAQAGKAGKGTAADPKAKPGRKAAKKAAKPADDEEGDEEEEEDEDEEEEETPAPKKGKKPAAKGKKGAPTLETLSALVVALIAFVLTLAAKVKGVKVPAALKAAAGETEEEDETEDEEEEEDEEEQEEEEEEDETEEGDEEEEEDDEEVETVRLKAADLAKMNLSQLHDVCDKINASDAAKKAKVKIDHKDVTSARILRERITKFASKYLTESEDEEEEQDEEEEETPKKGKKGAKAAPAKKGKKAADEDEEEEEEQDEESEEEDEEEDEEAEETERPDFIREGAKVEAFFEDEEPEWQPGSIESIDDDEGTAHVVLDSGEEADAPFDSLRALNKRPKARKGKK